MSVELSQKQQNSFMHQKHQSVYDKFQKAQQNMSNFKELLTKFSTQKKTHHNQPNVHEFEIPEAPKMKKPAINLILSEGWQYSGQTFEQKFHGYGFLLHKDRNVYSGQFKNGRMHGQGRLSYHELFEDLVDTNVEWEKYEGQFQDGNITGFGNLFLTNGLVIIGCWRAGKAQYYTKVQAATFDN